MLRLLPLPLELLRRLASERILPAAARGRSANKLEASPSGRFGTALICALPPFRGRCALSWFTLRGCLRFGWCSRTWALGSTAERCICASGAWLAWRAESGSTGSRGMAAATAARPAAPPPTARH